MEAKHKILLIDDEPAMLEAMSFQLSQGGYAIITAASGQEGIDKAKKEGIDLVITDMKMPGMDGLTVLEQIKAMDPDIEVIMVTAYETTEKLLECMKKGACDYINKSYNVDELLVVIEKALEKRHLRETVNLYETSKAIFSTIDMDDLLKIILESALNSLQADSSSLMLFDKEGKLYIAISSHLSEQIREETRIAPGEGLAGWIAEKKEPVLLTDELKDDSRFKDIKGRGGIKSALVLPLVGKEKVLGVLTLNRTNSTKNFTERDLRRANIFSSLVTLAIENANLYKERKELQDHFVQTEKMAAVGQLASGIAHEVKNPLAIILQAADYLEKEKSPKTEKGLELLGMIKDSVMRADKIVRALLDFSRKAPLELKPCDINKTIETAFDLIGARLPLENIKINKDIMLQSPLVMIDKNQIEQVFINLILNSLQAMPEGGELTIRTYIQKPTEIKHGLEKRTADFFKLGEVVFICEIEDNGVGIPEDKLKDVFNPFFTTKPPGEGTGLGLSIAQTIIEKHKGLISIENRPGKGTKAIIVLHLA